MVCERWMMEVGCEGDGFMHGFFQSKERIAWGLLSSNNEPGNHHINKQQEKEGESFLRRRMCK